MLQFFPHNRGMLRRSRCALIFFFLIVLIFLQIVPVEEKRRLSETCIPDDVLNLTN